MKPWLVYLIGIGLTPLATIATLGFYHAGEFTFYSILGGGLILFGYYKTRPKFKSTKINLGTATGFVVPTNNAFKSK